MCCTTTSLCDVCAQSLHRDCSLHLAASEMTEIKSAVSGVKAALEDLRANADPSRAAMLKLNLKEARDILARRLQETAPGVAPAGTSADGSLAAVKREASVLLDEVDAQFFSV